MLQSFITIAGFFVLLFLALALLRWVGLVLLALTLGLIALAQLVLLLVTLVLTGLLSALCWALGLTRWARGFKATAGAAADSIEHFEFTSALPRRGHWTE